MQQHNLHRGQWQNALVQSLAMLLANANLKLKITKIKKERKKEKLPLPTPEFVRVKSMMKRKSGKGDKGVCIGNLRLDN